MSVGCRSLLRFEQQVRCGDRRRSRPARAASVLKNTPLPLPPCAPAEHQRVLGGQPGQRVAGDPLHVGHQLGIVPEDAVEERLPDRRRRPGGRGRDGGLLGDVVERSGRAAARRCAGRPCRRACRAATGRRPIGRPSRPARGCCARGPRRWRPWCRAQLLGDGLAGLDQLVVFSPPRPASAPSGPARRPLRAGTRGCGSGAAGARPAPSAEPVKNSHRPNRATWRASVHFSPHVERQAVVATCRVGRHRGPVGLGRRRIGLCRCLLPCADVPKQLAIRRPCATWVRPELLDRRRSHARCRRTGSASVRAARRPGSPAGTASISPCSVSTILGRVMPPPA